MDGVISRDVQDLPFDSLEAVAIAAQAGAVYDIIQHLRVRVEGGVHEPDRPLADCGSLLIEL